MRLLTCVCSLIYYPCSYVYCHLWALASALCSHARAHACAHMFLHPCPCSHMCVGFHVLSSVLTPFFFWCALMFVLSRVCFQTCVLASVLSCVRSCVWSHVCSPYSFSHTHIVIYVFSCVCSHTFALKCGNWFIHVYSLLSSHTQHCHCLASLAGLIMFVFCKTYGT